MPVAEPPEGGGNAPDDRLAVVATLCLAAVGAGAILREVAQVPWAGIASAPFLLAYLALRWRWLRGASRGMIVVTAAVAAYATPRIDPATLAKVIDRSVYFPAFLILLGLLREAAALSPTVIKAGRFLIAQPPGRRYLALAAGGQVFGILLNLGGYALLLDMMKRANTLEAAQGRPEVVAIRERRMVIAALRGFLGAPFWSPLSVSMALVLASLPQVAWLDVAPLGVVLALAYISLGWLFDRVQSPPTRVGYLASPEPDGLRAFLGVSGHVAALAAATVALELATRLPFQTVLLIVVPLYAIGWATAIRRDRGFPGAIAAAVATLARGARASYPRYGNEVTIFATSLFLGGLIAALAPPGAVGELVAKTALSPATVTPAICLAVAALSVLGVNPMITVSILATTLASAPIPGVSPRELVVTFCGAWALSVGIGPLISTTVMTSGIIGKPLTTIAWRWNGAFGVTALALFCLLLYVVEL